METIESLPGMMVHLLLPYIAIVFAITLLMAIFRGVTRSGKGRHRARGGTPIPRAPWASTNDWAAIEKGLNGEEMIHNMIREWLDPVAYRLISDLTIGSDGNTTQIDHVVVCRQGIFVVETKNYTGWIYGDPEDRQWMQTVFGKRSQFQNPLRQNYRHIKVLEPLLGLPFSCFKSVVVFAGDAEIKSAMPPNVVLAGELISYIEEQIASVLSDQQVERAASLLASVRDGGDLADRRLHVENLAQNHRPVGPGESAPPCPRCSSHMVLRKARSGSGPFWGCSTFPRCRGVRNCS